MTFSPSTDVDGIDVIFTSRIGSISATVVSAGQPVADTSVVVFGADATTWMHLALTLRGGVTNAQGVFSIGGLAARAVSGIGAARAISAVSRSKRTPYLAFCRDASRRIRGRDLDRDIGGRQVAAVSLAIS